MKSKLILYGSLYATIIFFVGEQLQQFGKSIIDGGQINILEKSVKNTQKRVLNAKDLKLISAAPNAEAVVQNFNASINNLLFSRKKLEKKEEEILEIDFKEDTAEKEVELPPAPVFVQNYEVPISSLFDNGAIIAGRFTKNGSIIRGATMLTLLQTDIKKNRVKIRYKNKSKWHDIKDGKVNFSEKL